MYKIYDEIVPAAKRESINEKILYCILSGDQTLTREMAYNFYTGKGGLHQLDRHSFDNYHQYAEAKKEIEMGQFFTPHSVCQQLVELARPAAGERVADFCCGMGNFFNWLPAGVHAYGVDWDVQAVRVAQFLYPEATIVQGDIRFATPAESFDIVFGNPPFNLKWEVNGETVLSQLYYCRKAAQYLNPGGLLLLVMPASFLKDEFWNGSMVSEINRDFSFIGQCALPDDAFSAYGVASFQTKVMAFQRRSEFLEAQPYSAAYITMEELSSRMTEVRKGMQQVRLCLIGEAKAHAESDQFGYKLSKYLYEIRTHASIAKHYADCMAFISKFRNQKPPENAAEFNHWYKYVRITEKDVLNRLRRIIRGQNQVEQDKIALVRRSGGFALKCYSVRMRSYCKNMHVSAKLFIPVHELVESSCDFADYLPVQMRERIEGLDVCQKILARKRKLFQQQQVPFADLEPDGELVRRIADMRFRKEDGAYYALTPLQQADAARLFSKRYSLVNWQQGCGKTVVSFQWGNWLLQEGRVRNVIVVAPAVATNLTWIDFLKTQGVPFRCINRPEEIRSAQSGEFLVLSTSMLGRRLWDLKRFLRLTARRHALVFDESDEISNAYSKRTRYLLDLFRRLPFKMLSTGTATRNDISELYSQLSLLYNHSYNFLCCCPFLYLPDKETGELEEKANDYYMKPFPVKGGNRVFQACYSPGKKSVFGIRKNSQDIYNADDLRRILEYTVITRRFREVAGNKYSVDNVSVVPGQGEIAVYRKVLDEYFQVLPLYFRSTGDARKDASLRLVRIIELLRRACSTAHLMPGYVGPAHPAKAAVILDMIRERDTLVAVGCLSLESLAVYQSLFEQCLDRPLFVISGDISFARRKSLIARFQESGNGILLSTQQSLSSSVNIPACNEVIVEALQWNVPRIEQYYMRFIRFDSKDFTHVHLVTYLDTIEQNILALLVTKERLNEFVKSGVEWDSDSILAELGVSPDVFKNLIEKGYDREGHLSFGWGQQRITG